MRNQDGNQKRSLRIALLVTLALAAAALVIAGIAVFAYRAGQAGTDPNAKGVVIDANASEWNKDLENLSGEQKGIQIPGYGEITVRAESSVWNITLPNPEDNDCYFRYTITIDDSETPIYTSDYIEPGKAITQFEVSEPLTAGDYSIYLNIAAYSMDGENTRLNGARVKADLHVVP